MSAQITFQQVDSLSPAVLTFWRQQLKKAESWIGLAGSQEWYRMMAGGSKKPAVVVVVEVGGDRIAMVVPLLFQFANLGVSVGSWLRPKRALVCSVCGGDIIGDLSDDEECTLLRNLWDQILRYAPDVEAIILDHVDERRLARLRKGRKACCEGFMYVGSRRMPHYRLVLPLTYEAFKKLRTASSIKKIEGRERAMIRETGGSLRLVEICRMKDWLPYANDITRLMNTTWQAMQLGHVFDIENYRRAAERGLLRSFLLLAGDTPAAFVLGYQGEGVYLYEQIGYNAILAKYSPGTSLLYRLIQRLYEENTPECLDFGEGEAEYKRVLATQTTYAQSVMIVRNRMDLRLRFWGLRVVIGVKCFASRITEAIGIKQRLIKRQRAKAVSASKTGKPQGT